MAHHSPAPQLVSWNRAAAAAIAQISLENEEQPYHAARRSRHRRELDAVRPAREDRLKIYFPYRGFSVC